MIQILVLLVLPLILPPLLVVTAFVFDGAVLPCCFCSDELVAFKLIAVESVILIESVVFVVLLLALVDSFIFVSFCCEDDDDDVFDVVAIPFVIPASLICNASRNGYSTGTMVGVHVFDFNRSRSWSNRSSICNRPGTNISSKDKRSKVFLFRSSNCFTIFLILSCNDIELY